MDRAETWGNLPGLNLLEVPHVEIHLFRQNLLSPSGFTAQFCQIPTKLKQNLLGIALDLHSTNVTGIRESNHATRWRISVDAEAVSDNSLRVLPIRAEPKPT